MQQSLVGAVVIGLAVFLMYFELSPRFGVRCGAFIGPDDADAGSRECRITGFFGPWLVETTMPSVRVREWDVIFLRPRGFLESHVVSRTD